MPSQKNELLPFEKSGLKNEKPRSLTLCETSEVPVHLLRVSTTGATVRQGLDGALCSQYRMKAVGQRDKKKET